jgi:biopolymer transport protein ExbD
MDYIAENIVLLSFIAVYLLLLIVFIVCILFFPDEMIQDIDWEDKFKDKDNG